MEEIIHVAIGSACSIIVLFSLTKIMGNREMSQLSMFDYVSGITIGSITGEMATSLEDDWRKPLVAMIVYTLANLLIAIGTNKSIYLRRVLTGKTLVLFAHDKINYKYLKKAKMDISEFLVQCRQKGYFDLSYIEVVVLEPNGQLSILPKSDYRPLTPYDSGVKVQRERPIANIVIDGKILKENLNNIGKTEQWLMKELNKREVSQLQDAFLVTCDAQDKITVYKKIEQPKQKDIL